jgi:hypothetical protein
MNEYDDEDEDIDFTNYVVDYNKLYESPGLLAVTRLLVTELRNNPYKSVGHFFKNLSDEDLKLLLNIADTELDDDINNQPNNDFSELVLISQMLADAEGSGGNMDLSQVTRRTNQFVMFLTMESLHRKKLVKLYHDNMSFGEDAGDKIVVEKL